ncbi:MAG: hypothetical protein ACRDOO_17195 [Actinomadura sp.]
MSRLPFSAALVLLPVATVLLAACANDAASPSATEPATPARATTPAPSTPAPSSPPAAQPPTIATAADGRKLSACRDGECEVVIKAGDVLRFGNAVKAKPKIDMLFVVGVSGEGAVFSMPSGFTTTANGTIELNNALTIEVGVPDRNRVAVRISRVR